MENRQNRPKERNSLLKQYYGISGKATINNQSTVGDRPFDLDGNTFNSSMYFAHLLKEKSLRDLVEVDSSLVTEIREIDGDMKTLVYENYNKFISATDTIKNMRSNVENMECEMSRLNENIKTISDQTEVISSKLGPDRDKIQQLSTAQNSLKRLQFIFDLPHRLQSYADKKKYRQAIQYHSKARRVLDGIKAFSSIQKECKAIIENIRKTLWKEIELDSVENMRLLILLGEDPSALRREYVRM
ncbi:Vps51/Vps67-domain-containing protein [Sporodiniella umbellata]|nr:Vps51/Vps67-domain-containing protein [Sporodiniella umbellata]